MSAMTRKHKKKKFIFAQVPFTCLYNHTMNVSIY